MYGRILSALVASAVLVSCSSPASPGSVGDAGYLLTIIPGSECPAWPAATPPELWRVPMTVVVESGTIEATTTDATGYTSVMFLRIYNRIAPFSGELGGGYRPPTKGWLLTAGSWPEMIGGIYGPTDGRVPVRAEGSLATSIRGTWQGHVSVQKPEGTWTSCGWPIQQFVLERASR